MIKSLLTSLAFIFTINYCIGQVSQNMTLISNWNPGGFPTAGSLMYNDVWGYADCSGNEYAIMGGAGMYHFIDITNPGNPVEIASITSGDVTTWRDMKTYSSYAYGVCDSCNEGLAVFDMSDLPNSVTLIDQYTNNFGSAHNIYVDTDNARLYAVGTDTQSGGVLIFDLAANPANPPLLANISLPGGYVHDIFVQNNIAYASSGNNGLWVYDLTNPTNVITLGNLTSYPQQGYNHSGWITNDGQGFIFADETFNRALKYCDISNLSNISVTSLFRSKLLAPADTASIAHNPFIRDNYVIISYYHDGLQVFDISDPNNITQEAWYDTYTGHSGYSGFHGNWGAYPFLPSGYILASDMYTGLYVLEPTSFGFSGGGTGSPPSVSINVNGSPSFCAGGFTELEATTNGVFVQWYKDGVAIPDATSTTYQATESGDYYAVAGNSSCTASSNTQSISVVAAPDATLNVGAFNEICEGEILLLSVAAGEPSYQWTLNGVPVGNNSNMLLADQQGDYQVTVDNGSCVEISDITTVVVQPLPSVAFNVNTNPTTICTGELLNLSVPAGADLYQWAKDGVPFSGNTNTIQIADPGDYQVVVTDQNCENVSSVMTVIVESFPDVTLSETGQIDLCDGEVVTVSVTLGADSYTWFRDGIPVGSTPALDVSLSGVYFVEASNTNCVSTSQNLVVTEGDTPNVTLNVPLENEICEGETVIVTVPSGADSYLWYFNNMPTGNTTNSFTATATGTYYVEASNSNCTAISEQVVVQSFPFPNGQLIANSSTEICEGESVLLTTTTNAPEVEWYKDNVLIAQDVQSYPAVEAGNYYVITRFGADCDFQTNSINIVVNATPFASLNITGNVAICEGDFIVLTVPSGAQNYSWTKDGVVVAANTNSFQATESGTYQVTASNGVCEEVSDVAVLAVNTMPDASLNVPTQNEICEGENVVISVAAGAENYEWTQNGVVLAETSNTLTATEAGNYQVVVSNGDCVESSEIVDVSVTPFPSAALNISTDQFLCEGEMIVASVPVGAETYTWYLNDIPIGNTTNSIDIFDTGFYYVEVSNGNCFSTSEVIESVVTAQPTISLDVNSFTEICEDMPLVVTNSGQATTHIWKKDGEIIGSDANAITITESGIYTLEVANGDCTETSDAFEVSVLSLPNIELNLTGQVTICEGESVVLEVAVSADDYDWLKDGNLISQTGNTLTVMESGSYYVKATNGTVGACVALSETVEVVVTPLPTTNLSVGSMNQLCEGSILTVTNNTNPDQTIWYQNGVVVAQDVNELDITEAGDYYIEITNDGCSAISDEFNVTIVDEPDATLNVSDPIIEICEGDSFELEVMSGAVDYTWYLNDEVVATGQNTLTATEAGNYYVIAGDISCNATSSTVAVDIIPIPDVTLNIPNQVEICEGDFIEISVPDGAETYVWVINAMTLPAEGNSITVSQPGNYLLIAGNGNCTANTGIISVTQIDLPDIEIIPPTDINLCEGETAVATINGEADELTWFFNDEPVAQNIDSLEMTETGNYYVIASNSGCEITTEVNDIEVTTFPELTASESGIVEICEGGELEVFADTDAETLVWYVDDEQLSGTDNSIVLTEGSTFFAVASNGDCSVTSDVGELVVNPFPDAVISANVTEFCEGDSAVLTTNGVGEEYHWFLNGNEIINANENEIIIYESGSYTVMIAANNCDALSEATDITVFESEEILIEFTDGILTTSSAGINYQWFFENEAISGANEPDYEPLENGNYYVVMTDDNGCISTSASIFVIISGVVDAEISNSISFFPNPFKSKFYLVNDSDYKIEKIEIFNMLGQQISFIENDDWTEIDLGESLPSGAYVITIYLKENDMEQVVVKSLIHR